MNITIGHWVRSSSDANISLDVNIREVESSVLSGVKKIDNFILVYYLVKEYDMLGNGPAIFCMVYTDKERVLYETIE